eukprot:10727111-Heterocapsa_arctica.AAC.1
MVAALQELRWGENGPRSWKIDGICYDLEVTSPKLIEQMAIEAATAKVWKKASSGANPGRTWEGSQDRSTGRCPGRC